MPAGVLSESRAPGQALPVYRRNEQLQTGPTLGGDQEGMELGEGGADQAHQVRAAVRGVAGDAVGGARGAATGGGQGWVGGRS